MSELGEERELPVTSMSEENTSVLGACEFSSGRCPEGSSVHPEDQWRLSRRAGLSVSSAGATKSGTFRLALLCTHFIRDGC